MTKQDIQLIKQFVDRVEIWHDQLTDKSECIHCGVIPDRMLQLGRALKAFVEAWEQKHGKIESPAGLAESAEV